MTQDNKPISGIWLLIIVGCFISMTSFGIRTSFGLFMSPISMTFSWDREVMSLALALQNIFWGLSQPIAGALSDKWGARPVIFIGALIYAAGVFLIPFSQDPWLIYLSLGIAVGVGVGFTSFAIIMAALSKLLPVSKRSFTMGLVTASGSLGQLLVVPIAQMQIDLVGWEQTASILAMMALCIALASWVLAKPPSNPSDEDKYEDVGLTRTIICACQTPSYVLLTAGFFVCGFQVTFIGAHLPTFIVDQGLGPLLGAYALALIGLFNIIGANVAGWWGGQHSKPYGLSFIYLSRSAITLMFIMLPISEASVLLYAAGTGLLWLSTVPLTSGLVASFFGVRYMGTLFGLVFFSHQLGAFLGVWLGGVLYDQTNSYDVIWWLNIAFGILAGILHLPIQDRSFSHRLRAAEG